MSSDDAAPSTSNGTSPQLELDVARLHALPSEQQELYLLTFTSDLARHVSALDSDGASAEQIYLKRELFQIITLSSPAPTRAIRNNIGRCFAGIFGKGDRKLLFESVNELISLVAGGKQEKELRSKHAAVHCLGEILRAAGDSVISLASLACSTLLRALKHAQNHAGLRSSVFKALAKILEAVGGSIDDSTARDIWKPVRSAAVGDKASLVQASACKCLEALVKRTPYFDNQNDLDLLKSTIWKIIDSSTPAVRHSAASALSAALVKNYSEFASRDASSKSKKSKKVSKKAPSAPIDEEDIERPESPTTKPGAQLAFSLGEILRHLSNHYVRMSTNNKSRAALAICYIRVIQGLGPRAVERQYGVIASHFFDEILSNPNIYLNRYKLLTARNFIRIILEGVVGEELLGEAGQLSASKWLINDILKNYPQVMKERPEPNKHVLVGALSALASLIDALGSAVGNIAETCRDTLLQVLQNPSYSVQILTSHCLRSLVLAVPQQLLPCLTICMNSVNRELNLLSTPRHSSIRCLGFSNALSALLSTSPLQPLYGSVDVFSRILSLATGLLKSSSQSELRVSSTQIQVAWILIGGLMTLGPNFVKIHLSQLLLLWKNALPKPLAKDNTAQRSLLELSFLAHVRECALGSMLAFLENNGRLLTVDVSKRLATMLQNTTHFLSGLPSKKTTEDVSQRLASSLQLRDIDLMVKRRVLQCYIRLVNLSPTDSTESILQSNVLTMAVSFFAEPDNYSPSSLSTNIASSAGNFDSVWEVGDNCGFGVTSLVRGLEIRSLPGEERPSQQHHWLTRHGPEGEVDQTLLSPICGAIEHDSVSLYLSPLRRTEQLPDPPATEVVNAAIQLFAICLPLQSSKVQEGVLEQIATFLSTNSLQRDPARKAAMTINVATALLSTLKIAVKETSCAAGNLKAPPVEKGMQELLRDFVIHNDEYVRNIAYEGIGRLCSSAGNAFTTSEIKHLVDMIVTNREPNARAGCAVALGCIHSQVGGMAAGYHLKTILSILMSLCNDPHPVVHFWALDGLARVADSAGLTFAGYVSSTLGMLARLYVADTHNEEVSSIATSNIEAGHPTTAALARCTDSLINVLGPDLQDMAKVRDLVTTLVTQFQTEVDPLVLIESLKCLEHFALYASGQMDFALYVRILQSHLKSASAELRDVAIDGLYNLMKRNAEEVIQTADAGLEEQLWLTLDDAPHHEGMRNLIRNWLQQTSLSHSGLWVDRCQNILTKARKTEEVSEVPKAAAMPDLQDEEVAGFAAASGAAKEEAGDPLGAGQELLRWQVRTFAMDCLSEMLAVVGREVTAGETEQAHNILQQRIADIVRLAFSASTADVIELRIWGLRVIDQILKLFGKTPDPDFTEVSLLEQYQAQIGSALTPAFAADSSPELAAEAINVCATFIATGIVTDVDRMGRILKLLVSALENFSSDSEIVAIGDLKSLSSNAQVMVRMSVFSAWAELQVASAEEKYLVDVLKPHIATLTPLWLSSLREFARLRFEPDISSTGPTSLSGSLDSVYSALNRETLLKFYQESWLKLVDAIASLIEEDTSFVFDALDGKQTGSRDTNASPSKSDINYREEPVAFFFVLFGIAFEALVGRPGSDSLGTEQTLEILQAVKKILRPSVSGHAIYEEVVFSETMDLFDRLVLTEGLDIQAVIVEIARNLCVEHPSAKKAHEPSSAGDNLSEEIEQLFELTRIIVMVLAGLLPNLTDPSSKLRHPLSDEAVSVIYDSLDALVDAAGVFPAVIRTDLHASIIHIFSTILGTSACQQKVVPQILPILKRFISSIAQLEPENAFDDESVTTSTQLRGCLKRFLSILLNAQKREAEASVACAKNALLASTLLLTSGSSAIPPNDGSLFRLLDEMLDCIGDTMTSKVALSCLRTLLLSTSSSSQKASAAPTNNAIARHLVPRLITLLSNPPPDATEAFVAARPIIAQTLTLLAPTLSAESQRPYFYAVIIPALLARATIDTSVEPAGESPSPAATAAAAAESPAPAATATQASAVYKETATRLLELAAADQLSFRTVVARMSPDQKAFLETVLRESGSMPGLGRPGPGAGASAVHDQVGDRQPSIALKMDFGA
ncbi:HEAT repeat protein-like protein [Xylona heveae TC161]|uniref:HEAT repeat protein-like protein n=1 Tax=Xylona heveae (strain CBS 132557 / TC161) TaxID=1328760 RepID=A0A165FTI3_XYLHT|nr:HEAT repeat protein-like protein [Xylona heveae TC161]KZF21359.1 HEAT repeat protein-like protein [Xylona heveae TC161]